MTSNQIIFTDYANDSKNVCISTGISILLILIFIISPLKKYVMTSNFFKIVIILILGFSFYTNIKNNYQFFKKTNVDFLNFEPNNIKTNILCSSIYSLFILILLISVVKTFF
jgi:hypothetical protein